MLKFRHCNAVSHWYRFVWVYPRPHISKTMQFFFFLQGALTVLAPWVPNWFPWGAFNNNKIWWAKGLSFCLEAPYLILDVCMCVEGKIERKLPRAIKMLWFWGCCFHQPPLHPPFFCSLLRWIVISLLMVWKQRDQYPDGPGSRWIRMICRQIVSIDTSIEWQTDRWRNKESFCVTYPPHDYFLKTFWKHFLKLARECLARPHR